MHKKLKRFTNIGCVVTLIIGVVLLVGLSIVTRQYVGVGTAEMLNRALTLLTAAAFTLGMLAVFTALQFIL
jgi:hypothetical protein